VRTPRGTWESASSSGALAHEDTGSSLGADERVGWYVGWVEIDTTTFVFRLNIDVVKPSDAAARVLLQPAALSFLSALFPSLFVD
jgi:beta-lactamase class D